MVLPHVVHHIVATAAIHHAHAAMAVVAAVIVPIACKHKHTMWWHVKKFGLVLIFYVPPPCWFPVFSWNDVPPPCWFPIFSWNEMKQWGTQGSLQMGRHMMHLICQGM